jgi:outer membrane protein assembly factor BamE (lipoprotein component of BamABCDE complex)
MGRLAVVLAAVAAVVVGGCVMAGGGATSGTRITQDAIDHIVKGRTTRAQLEALIGSPDYVGMMGDGRRMLVYSYMDTGTQLSVLPLMAGMNSNMRHQTLQVILSKNNVVQDFEFSDKTTLATSRATGWYGHGNVTTVDTPASER